MEKSFSICGVCRLPLHRDSTDGDGSQNCIFICCSNYTQNQDSCSSTVSPFYHLDCTGIPKKSELYRTSMSQQHNKSLHNLGSSTRIGDPLDSSTKNVDSTSTTNEKIDDQENNTLFFCPSCDVQGSSRFLLEYFERFRKRKMNFYNDEESVRFKDCLDEAFVMSLIRESEAAYEKCLSHKNKMKKTEIVLSSMQDIWNGIISMGNDNESKIHGKDQYDITSIEQSKSKAKTKKRDRCLSNSGNEISKKICGIHPNKPQFQRDNIGQKNFSLNQYIDPKFFIGQPVRIFCDVTNSYHVGRIIDWRTNNNDESNKLRPNTAGNHLHSKTDPIVNSRSRQISRMEGKTELGIDPNIAQTEYLVRFRAGLDGRKVSLHQWLYLEEHPLMVGLALVWVKVSFNVQTQRYVTKGSSDKNTSIQYRPAQLVLRTALEMTPVPNIQRDTDDPTSNQKALAIFFGKQYHQSVLDVPCSNTLDTDYLSDLSCSPSIIEFNDSNKKLNVLFKRTKIQDRVLQINTVLACMEKEEQSRIRKWQGLNMII